MSKCLHENATLLNDECPNPSDGDPFRIQKFAKYWSYFLNNSPSSLIGDWFVGRVFSSFSTASPAIMMSGKLIKQEASMWRAFRKRAIRFGLWKTLITCDIPAIPVVLKCVYEPDRRYERCPLVLTESQIRNNYTMEDAHLERFYSDGAKQALIYEKNVYSCVISNFEDVPFFVFPIATFEKTCTADDITASTAKRDNLTIDDVLISQVFRANAGCLEPGKFHITVSENCGGLSFSEYIGAPFAYMSYMSDHIGNASEGDMEKYYYGLTDWAMTKGLPRSHYDIKPEQINQLYLIHMRKYFVAIIQLLAALQSMQKHGLCHNDLHFRNIMIKPDETFYFDTRKKQVVTEEDARVDAHVIEMNDMVKIFDWDRARSVDQGENKFLEEFKFYTKEYNGSADTLAVLKGLNAGTKPNVYGTMLRSGNTISRIRNHHAWALETKSGPHIACMDSATVDTCGEIWPEELHALIKTWAGEVYDHAVIVVLQIDLDRT
jgi:hypothetical protein